ncbi:MAG: heparinase II/III family protein [Pseudolysinimonas sp.]|uniref:heparinase II/III domain-containing protein n=1 Tax=Pseudolysinimonas sp. TaxID=2680009 RepID=UPI003263984F
MTNGGSLTEKYALQLGTTADNLAAALVAALRPPATALPVAPATDRTVWELPKGMTDADTARALTARAERDLGTPWPQPLASAALRIHLDGDRDGWEQQAFARQHRLSRAAVAAAVTLDDRYLDEVADGVWLLCEQSSWCWPAHDDIHRRTGSVLPDVTDPFLDLGVGEVVGQLAWVDQLLGDNLDERYPGIRARVRHEARVRVWQPFINRRDWHWLGLDGNVHNWNPWIHSNLLVAALRLLDDPVERAAIVALTVEGIDRYVAALPDDGAIDEGYGYWWNGACRALEALDILNHATDGRLDATSIPALRATVGFPHRMQLGGDWYVNFADSQAKPSSDQPWHALYRAAVRFDDDAARDHATSHRAPGSPVASETAGLGRLLRAITDPSWITATPGASSLPATSWSPSTQVLVARETAGTARGLALAVKGGHNGENHNHNDVGSFIVASDGVPVIVDAGRPTYTAATFGPDRYDIWTMQSSWHNVPEVRGTAQRAGVEFAAGDVDSMLTADVAGLELDLAATYAVAGLSAWHRAVRLERGTAARVVINDTWTLDPWNGAGEEPATTVRLLVAGAVQLDPGRLRIIPLENAPAVVVTWSPDAPASLVTRALDDPLLSAVWGATLHRVDIDVTSRAELGITVELDPANSGDPS